MKSKDKKEKRKMLKPTDLRFSENEAPPNKTSLPQRSC